MNHQKLLDQFAMSALNALIAKSPFFDLKGDLGKNITADELQAFKKELTATAYEYAGWMLIARENGKKWLQENNGFFTDYGIMP